MLSCSRVFVVVTEAILADACHVVGLVVSPVGQLVASPVAVLPTALRVAPTLAAAVGRRATASTPTIFVGTAAVGVRLPCVGEHPVPEHPALEHHVDVAPWIENGDQVPRSQSHVRGTRGLHKRWGEKPRNNKHKTDKSR